MFHVAEMILRCIYYLLCSYHVKLLHTSLHLLLLYSCTHCRLCFDLQPPPPPNPRSPHDLVHVLHYASAIISEQMSLAPLGALSCPPGCP